jgi:hypothetical protein
VGKKNVQAYVPAPRLREMGTRPRELIADRAQAVAGRAGQHPTGQPPERTSGAEPAAGRARGCRAFGSGGPPTRVKSPGGLMRASPWVATSAFCPL